MARVTGLNARELATVLGALRMFQRGGFGDHPEELPFFVHDIVTDGGEIKRPLDSEEIESLILCLNTGV